VSRSRRPVNAMPYGLWPILKPGRLTPAAVRSTRWRWTLWRCWKRAGARWSTRLGRRFPESELGDIAPEELSAFPGVQEVLGLHEVGELAKCGEWDHIVVDCASTADALRMLTLPATFALYVERAWPRHRRAFRRRVDDVRSTAVVELLERISASVDKLSALLTDGTRVGAHLVLTAERVVAAEAVRTLGSLALMGVRIEELIVNQILMQDDSYEYRNLPAHPAFDWYSERISEQRTVLDELDAAIGDVALVLTPHLAGEPIGAKALAELLDSARRRDGRRRPARCVPSSILNPDPDCSRCNDCG